ncbi:hypothetical protein ACMXYX_14605 [Neptuniibacter sp. QD72_48]|uniref:hypothetical protein n=1 Tax=Neptuniibacter sp. QD72_48 TaxID=3398214 RepID=UPI0039F45BA9
MLKKLFVADLYLKVRKNQFEIKNLTENGAWKIATPEQPFTTDRLLIGQFSVAEPVLKELVKVVMPRSFMKKSAQILIHPIDMVEGGLCEVEERVFTELGLGAGAFKVKLHVGEGLTDEDARKLLQIG